MASITSIPAPISQFFETLYKEGPEVRDSGKVQVYKSSQFSLYTDKYQGWHIDVDASIEPEQVQPVQSAIHRLIQSMQTAADVDSVWVNFPIHSSTAQLAILPPSLFTLGNTDRSGQITDIQGGKQRYWTWLNEKKVPSIPSGATHQLGATALLCDSTARKVLLVVTRDRSKKWSLPGGTFDPKQDKTPHDTALREAREEGGIQGNLQIRKAGTLGLTEFPNNPFARAISPICYFDAPGSSELPLHPPEHEIVKAEWIPYADLLLSNDGKFQDLELSPEILTPLKASIYGNMAEKIADKGWMVVHSCVPND